MYGVYCKVNVFEFGVKKKDLMTQQEFRTAIALYWINPEEYLTDEKELTTRKRKSSSQSYISSVTLDSEVSSEREVKMFANARHINDDSLSLQGLLICCLDAGLGHLPYE